MNIGSLIDDLIYNKMQSAWHLSPQMIPFAKQDFEFVFLFIKQTLPDISHRVFSVYCSAFNAE